MIIRAANSIDIYCKWKDVKPALARIAVEFVDQPILFLFNKEILLKNAGDTNWHIVGKISDMGFNHKDDKLSRNGQPPYKLDTSELATKLAGI